MLNYSDIEAMDNIQKHYDIILENKNFIDDDYTDEDIPVNQD